jgi:hypothetical protein
MEYNERPATCQRRRVTNEHTFGGRPRFLGVAVDEPAAGADEFDFLFLLPLARPRPRFVGVAPAVPVNSQTSQTRH